MARKELDCEKKTSYVMRGDSKTLYIRCQNTTSEDLELQCVSNGGL
jgi:hypothetical protein